MKSSAFTKIITFAFAAVLALSAAATAGAAEVTDSERQVSAQSSESVSTADEAVSELPSSYSSVELGYVTPIKSQSYNDCWAYAATELFESKLLRSGLEVGTVSVDRLNVWATTRLNGLGWQRTLASNGYNVIAAGYFTSWSGGVLEDDTEDLDLSGDVSGDLTDNDLVRYGVTAIRYLYKNDPDSIKRAIMDNGGVHTAYAQTGSCLNDLSYYMWDDYSGSYAGHAIEVVGWDDNYSRMNFGSSESERPDGDGAWLIRNSWGNYNSLGGYFWISYEDKYVFSDKYEPSYTIESFIETGSEIELKQNEIYGATYEFDYADSGSITFMNCFDFDDGYGTIDKVVFETTCSGADYDIYFVPVENDKPTSEQSEWVLLGSGSVEYNGYICADIDDYVVDAAEGAVAVKIEADSSDASAVSTIGVGEWLTSNGKYVFLNDSEYGDSFIMYDGEMYDLLDWYKEFNNDALGGTFVIKAVALEGGGRLTGDVNLDGKIDVDDATLVQKYAAEITELSEEAEDNADVNGDGEIDVDDATMIRKYAAGIITGFGAA